MKTILAAVTVAILATGCASQRDDVLTSFKGVTYERAVAKADLDVCRAAVQPGLNLQPELTPVEITSDSVIRANRRDRAELENQRAAVRQCMAAKGHVELIVVARK